MGALDWLLVAGRMIFSHFLKCFDGVQGTLNYERIKVQVLVRSIWQITTASVHIPFYLIVGASVAE